MRISDYLVAVNQVEKMKPTEGGDVTIEEKCRRMLQRAIDINDQFFQLKNELTDMDQINLLDQELEKIQMAQRTLELRLTQGGSMIADERVNEALNHIEAVYQSLSILTA